MAFAMSWETGRLGRKSQLGYALPGRMLKPQDSSAPDEHHYHRLCFSSVFNKGLLLRPLSTRYSHLPLREGAELRAPSVCSLSLQSFPIARSRVQCIATSTAPHGRLQAPLQGSPQTDHHPDPSLVAECYWVASPNNSRFSKS